MRTLAELGEFELIGWIRRAVPERARPHVRVGLGDDAAVLRLRAGEELVVSCDEVVEDVHFDLARQSGEHVARCALAAAVSDLAAMGARPLGFTTAFAAPPSLPLAVFRGLVRGFARDAERHACPWVGGNIARARETSLATTVLGALPRGTALVRSGARAGDRLCVTGQPGAQALARAAAERRGRRLRRVPEPRLAAGQALRRLAGRGACIDISDGLAADLGHLLEASGVGAEVDPSQLPIPWGQANRARRLGLDPLKLAIAGGDDYELLFSVRPGAPGAPVLSRRLGVTVSEIGHLTRQPGLRGLPGALGLSGWRHF